MLTKQEVDKFVRYMRFHNTKLLFASVLMIIWDRLAVILMLCLSLTLIEDGYLIPMIVYGIFEVINICCQIFIVSYKLMDYSKLYFRIMLFIVTCTLSSFLISNMIVLSMFLIFYLTHQLFALKAIYMMFNTSSDFYMKFYKLYYKSLKEKCETDKETELLASSGYVLKEDDSDA